VRCSIDVAYTSTGFRCEAIERPTDLELAGKGCRGNATVRREAEAEQQIERRD
jgi:hypothetical protein